MTLGVYIAIMRVQKYIASTKTYSRTMGTNICIMWPPEPSVASIGVVYNSSNVDADDRNLDNERR
jgi:hypothetical protein